MTVPAPHYLLFSDANCHGHAGRWRFKLEAADGSDCVEVADIEPDMAEERLDLLTVVRGLEALDQPSEVTLVGGSTYVRHGMRFGLSEWRTNGWRWEYFGQMVPVKNGDLWQRMDRALRIHQIRCCRRIDPGHSAPTNPSAESADPAPRQEVEAAPVRHRASDGLLYRLAPAWIRTFRQIAEVARRGGRWMSETWKSLLPRVCEGDGSCERDYTRP